MKTETSNHPFSTVQKIMKSKPWNKNRSYRMTPFTPAQIRLIREILRAGEQWRDLALFCLGICTMLRGTDLIGLRVSDVMHPNGDFRNEAYIIQGKTEKSVLVDIDPHSQDALGRWFKEKPKGYHDFIFTSLRQKQDSPISIVAYRKLIKKWCVDAKLDPSRYSTHSLRRTMATIVYEGTNNPEVCRHGLGHQSIQSTSTYLGVDKKDALEIFRRFRVT